MNDRVVWVVEKRTMGRPHGRWERGASAVEFALVALVLFFLLLGIIDFGRALYLQHSVSAAAHEVARAVAGSPNLSQNELKQIVGARAPVLNTNSVSISVNRDRKKREITVTISYPFEPIVPFIVPSGTTLSATVHLQY